MFWAVEVSVKPQSSLRVLDKQITSRKLAGWENRLFFSVRSLCSLCLSGDYRVLFSTEAQRSRAATKKNKRPMTLAFIIGLADSIGGASWSDL